MVKELEFHPIANIFPLMQGKAFEGLCEDIKANGLLEPIWLYEGKILDGRNRKRGCEAIGYELKETDFRTYEGDDPYSFVGSLNVHRRHLTSGQRAMAATHLTNNKKGWYRKKDQTGIVSQQQAADACGVKASLVELAVTVRNRGIPELVRSVEVGEASIVRAAKVSAFPPDKQRQFLEAITNHGASARGALKDISPGHAIEAPHFVKDLDEMAVRILAFFTAPQIDLLWDTIAKKQGEMIKARREKG